MAVELVGQQTITKGESQYVIRLLFDNDTSMQRIEYFLDSQLLYFIQFDSDRVEEPMTDLDVESLVSGFEYWFSVVGPDWRPEAF